VEKVYAIQAGREVRVIVENETMSDEQTVILSKDLAKKVEEELAYPGQIKCASSARHVLPPWHDEPRGWVSPKGERAPRAPRGVWAKGFAPGVEGVVVAGANGRSSAQEAREG